MEQRQEAGGEWPFAARGDELARVGAHLTTGVGAVVAGEAGSGKSRLVAEAAARARGFTVVRAVATQAAMAIPFGAFAHALAAQLPAGGNVLGQVAQQLRADAGAADLLVTVDDAQWLDPVSAALVHHLVSHGMAKVLATVRDGEPAPDPVVALWKDNLLPRVSLRPLSTDEVRTVLVAALAGYVEAGTVTHLARVTRGNVLWLRELVLAGLGAGTLSHIDGVWFWRGDVSLSARLQELIEARIGSLDPRVMEVLELVAFGEPLGLSMLVDFTSAKAVELAEDRGLVTTSGDGRRWQVRLGHPLYGQAVRDQCGRLHTRRRLRQLAEALQATGLRRREDMLRVAVWHLDSDTRTDPQLLLRAARLAWARSDLPLAARLARAAADSGGGLEATAVLGEVLLCLGRGDEAAEMMPAQCGSGSTDRERVEHAMGRALVLASVGAREDASRTLDAVATVADLDLRQDVLLHRGVIEFFSGRLDDATDLLRRVHDLGPLTARGTGHAQALQAWLHAYRGQSRQSLAVAESALANHARWRDEAPHALPTLLDARCTAHLFAGDLHAAAEAATAGTSLVGVPGGSAISTACFGAHLSQIMRLRGQVSQAVEVGREHATRLRAHNPYLGRCLGELAHAAALLGEVATARRALAEAEPLAECWVFTHLPVLLSRAWVAAAEGSVDEAVGEAIAVADLAQKCGFAGYELFALHDAVRLGAAKLVNHRLSALEPQVGGPLAQACARHAVAAAGSDGRELQQASLLFEQLGLVLYAAEAAAHSADAFRQEGRNASARTAEMRAWALARQCPGVRTPALVSLAAPELTARQREIAQLAATGMSNREIASRLTLSLRTVANHLQDAYTRLGVNRRTELAPLLRHLVRN